MEHRFATDSDLDLLAQWNHQLIGDEGHRNPMPVDQLRGRMKAWLAGAYKAVVFDLDSVPVAYALFTEDDREIYLRHLFVERTHRRQGIGKQAMGIVRKRIWPRDKRLTVEVLAANEGAVAFWRSVGYADYALTLEIVPTETGEQGHPSDALSRLDDA